jgi:hypothetical protein
VVAFYSLFCPSIDRSGPKGIARHAFTSCRPRADECGLSCASQSRREG